MTALPRLLRALVDDRRGVTGVEFAIAVTVFLMMMFGIIESGRMLYASHTLASAAQAGARYAIVHGSQSASPATTAQVEAEVRARLVNLDQDATDVDVTFAPNNNPGSQVQVDLAHQFAFVVPLLPFPDLVTLRQSAQSVILR